MTDDLTKLEGEEEEKHINTEKCLHDDKSLGRMNRFIYIHTHHNCHYCFYTNNDRLPTIKKAQIILAKQKQTKIVSTDGIQFYKCIHTCITHTVMGVNFGAWDNYTNLKSPCTNINELDL